MPCFSSRLIKLFGFVWIVVALQSCEVDKPGTYRNDKISSSKREDFHKLNEQLFAAIKDNRIDEVENMMSKNYLDNPGYKRTVELVGNRIKTDKYTVLDEYYINNVNDENPQNNNDIKVTGSGRNLYDQFYRSNGEESYIVLFIPKDIKDQWMISAFYDKYDYGWKLSNLMIGPYAFGGKTSPELLKKAKAEYGKGYIVDAVNTMELATKCARPNPGWQYHGEDSLYKFYGYVTNVANSRYKFPLIVEQVPTKPEIFRILTQTTAEGVFPMIYYLSKIDLKDTVALKKENDGIKKVIGKVLPGIDQDKKYILFSVFNEKPTGKKNPLSYDITDKLQ